MVKTTVVSAVVVFQKELRHSAVQNLCQLRVGRKFKEQDKHIRAFRAV
jgi:hypothetical protein